MFGFAKKTQSKAPTLLDGVIKSIYGANPPKKTADVSEATNLAADQLLGGVFERTDLVRAAEELNTGPMPYSTHDLAVSVALRAFKDVPPDDRRHLFTIQTDGSDDCRWVGKRGQSSYSPCHGIRRYPVQRV